jgi:hypothetical protein
MVIGLFLFVLLFGATLNTKGVLEPINHISGVRSTPSSLRSLPSNATLLAELADGMNFRVNDASQCFDGLTVINLGIYPNYTASGDRVGYMVVIDSDGTVVNGFYSDVEIASPQFLNSTTIFYSDKDTRNISLWNMVTNYTVMLPIPSGHHDVEYNPISNTFFVFDQLTLTTYYWDGKTWDVIGDDIVEYDWDGNEVWRWECNYTLPFNATEFHLVNETKRGRIDWLHSNSLYYDADNDMIYCSPRWRDCALKIDHATGDVIWGVGRYTGEAPKLAQYNIHGDRVNTLFFHPHDFEMIGPNAFSIFDNDKYNITRPNPEIGISRFLEFVVDETAGTATETWSWASPPAYYSQGQGNMNRLPSGNTYGLFNIAPEPIYNEVNEAGDTVWEMVLNITDNDVAFRGNAEGAENFYPTPQVVLDESSFSFFEGTTIDVGFNAWDVFKRRRTTDVTVRVMLGSTIFAEEDLELLPHWQVTPLTIAVSGVPPGLHNLVLEIENPDGIKGQAIFQVNVVSALFQPTNILLISGSVIIIIVLIVIVLAYFNSSKHKFWLETL